jgi:hypothetical protein
MQINCSAAFLAKVALWMVIVGVVLGLALAR